MKRKNSGVTLIALIVSVLVLLILAGVSIAVAVGDHDKGIISRAQNAKEMVEDDQNADDEFLQRLDSEDDENTGGEEETTKYTVYFYNGTSLLTSLKVEKGMTAVYPEGAKTPTKASTSSASYVFNGKWATTADGTTEATLTNITSNKTVYAMFDTVELAEYSVVFSYKNSSGTVVTSTITVTEGGSVASSQFPTVSTYTANNYKYTFSKWINSSNIEVTSLSNVTSDQTITAVYTSEYVCFVAGTKVLTENGLIDIEDIQTGVKVYSKNEATGEVELKEVKGTFINYVDYDMTKVTVNGEVIESTDGHDYYEVTKGWIDACKLEVGDRVLNSNNEEVVVENVETIEHTGNELTTVYNFEVADNHNYYVGESRILVHNVGSPTGTTSSPTAGDSCSSSDGSSPTEDLISPS